METLLRFWDVPVECLASVALLASAAGSARPAIHWYLTKWLGACERTS